MPAGWPGCRPLGSFSASGGVPKGVTRTEFRDEYLPLSTTSAQLEAVRLRSAPTNILRALLSIASATLLVRVFGMLSQIAITSRFGASAAIDAYFVATSGPVLLAGIITSALDITVIPIYARLRHRRPEEASRLFSTLLNLVIIGGIFLVIVLLVNSRQVIYLSAPGLDSSRAAAAERLVAVVYPTLAISAALSFLEAILNAEGQFGVPAYAGLLGPLCIGAFAWFVGSSVGVISLAIGSLVGLVLQMGVFLIRLRRARLQYRPVFSLRSPEMRAVWIAGWPALISACIGQFSLLVDQAFASSLPAGNIAALGFALKVSTVPIGILSAATARSTIPYLSRFAAIRDMRSFKQTLGTSVVLVALAAAVASVAMVIFANTIVRLLFERGAFSPDDAQRTATILVGFAFGLVPMTVGPVVAGAFTALGKTRELLTMGVYMVVANLVFDSIGVQLWGAFGIAAATSAVSASVLIISLVWLRILIGQLDLSIQRSLAPALGAIRRSLGPRLGQPQPSASHVATHSAIDAKERGDEHPGLLSVESLSGLLEQAGRPLLYVGSVLAAAVAGFAATRTDASNVIKAVVGIPLFVSSCAFPLHCCLPGLRQVRWLARRFPCSMAIIWTPSSPWRVCVCS